MKTKFTCVISSFIFALMMSSIVSSTALADHRYTCQSRHYLKSVLENLNRECGGYNSICKAKGYAGSTLEAAIHMCSSSGYSKSSCAQEVSCSNEIPVYKAKGYAGSTLEAAIQMCSSSGYSKSSCAQEVTAPEGYTICKAKGYAGSTLEAAIQMCSSSGYSTSSCSQEVTCN